MAEDKRRVVHREEEALSMREAADRLVELRRLVDEHPDILERDRGRVYRLSTRREGARAERRRNRARPGR